MLIYAVLDYGTGFAFTAQASDLALEALDGILALLQFHGPLHCSNARHHLPAVRSDSMLIPVTAYLITLSWAARAGFAFVEQTAKAVVEAFDETWAAE